MAEGQNELLSLHRDRVRIGAVVSKEHPNVGRRLYARGERGRCGGQQQWRLRWTCWAGTHTAVNVGHPLKALHSDWSQCYWPVQAG